MKTKTKSQRHNKPAMIVAGLLLAGGVSIAHAGNGDCPLIASDNSSVSIDLSPGVCQLVKTLDFTLASTSNVLVVFDLGHSHGCCHHDSLVFQLDLDGVTIFSTELPFIPGSPGGCDNTIGNSTVLGDVPAGDHTLEVILCDEAQNCILEIYACPPEGGLDLDIKPGSCPNSYNRDSHGVLPVALVGTDTFDVTQVDIDSILLVRKDGEGGSVAPNEGPPGPMSEFEDTATPFEGEEQCDCHDLEGDGILDLMMHFNTDEVVLALQLNDFSPGELVPLTLIGTLLDGKPFRSSDCIRLVPPGTSPGMLSVGSNLPGAWLDLSPLDLQLDGGGFVTSDGMFERTFPQTTVVTLTAPAAYHGWVFLGWLTDGGLVPGQSIDLTIGEQYLQQIEAIYRPAGPAVAPTIGH